MFKYKHADVIKAWLDGVPVQFKGTEGWITLSPVGEHQQSVPVFPVAYEYRIKPKTRRIRNYEFVSGHANPHLGTVARTHFSCHEEGKPGYLRAEALEMSAHFVRWVGDWIEVEDGIECVGCTD